MNNARPYPFSGFTLSSLPNTEFRQAMGNSHPMLDQRYSLETDVIEKTEELLFKWAMLRKGGMYIIGKQRIGKSRGMLRLKEKLAVAFPRMVLLYSASEEKPHESKERFCERLLCEQHYRPNHVTRNTRWQTLLTNRLIAHQALGWLCLPATVI